MAGKECREIVSERLARKILIENINERDENQLLQVLSKYAGSIAVVSLNRRAVTAAKSLGMRVLFIDSLTWLWNEIPKEYLLSDRYYYYNIFGAGEKLAGVKNAVPIPIITEELPATAGSRSNVKLLYVGGISNPLVSGISESYLKIFGTALQSASRDLEVVVTGDSSVVDFLSRYAKYPEGVSLKTMKRDEFAEALAVSERLVTTPGSTATFESFALGTPTAFLLPANLSQWRQLRHFTAELMAPSKMEWETYSDIGSYELEKRDEKEAIIVIREIADGLLNDENSLRRISQDMDGLLCGAIDPAPQKEFIEKIGYNGSSVMVSNILKLLKPSGN